MRSSEAPGPHLTPDEIVTRVFPIGEGAPAVPLHLAVCTACQTRVAQLREGWLLDRGAVEGVVDSIPAEFWNQQSASIAARVHEVAADAQKVRPFPFPIRSGILRRPVLAFGSLAAAVALVAGLTFLRPRPAAVPAPADATPVAAVVAPTDLSDEELLNDVEALLAEETPYATLIPEGVS